MRGSRPPTSVSEMLAPSLKWMGRRIQGSTGADLLRFFSPGSSSKSSSSPGSGSGCAAARATSPPARSRPVHDALQPRPRASVGASAWCAKPCLPLLAPPRRRHGPAPGRRGAPLACASCSRPGRLPLGLRLASTVAGSHGGRRRRAGDSCECVSVWRQARTGFVERRVSTEGQLLTHRAEVWRTCASRVEVRAQGSGTTAGVFYSSRWFVLLVVPSSIAVEQGC